MFATAFLFYPEGYLKNNIILLTKSYYFYIKMYNNPKNGGLMSEKVDEKTEIITEILKAMAHPARLKILEGLLENECNVSIIQEKLGLPQSTISQHLKTLKNAGIIRGRREGTKMCYSVVDEKVRKILEILV